MTIEDVAQLGRKATDALQAVEDAEIRWYEATAGDGGHLTAALAELLERVGYLTSQTVEPAPDSEEVDGEARLTYTLTEAGRAALIEGLEGSQ